MMANFFSSFFACLATGLITPIGRTKGSICFSGGSVGGSIISCFVTAAEWTGWKADPFAGKIYCCYMVSDLNGCRTWFYGC